VVDGLGQPDASRRAAPAPALTRRSPTVIIGARLRSRRNSASANFTNLGSFGASDIERGRWHSRRGYVV